MSRNIRYVCCHLPAKPTLAGVSPALSPGVAGFGSSVYYGTLADWELAKAGETPFNIDPLK